MTVHVKPSSARDSCDTTRRAETLRLEVEHALHGSSHCGLRLIRCTFVDGVATLNGDVASYYLKQVAQTIVGRLPQVQRVDNQLRVVGIATVRFDS